MLEIHDHGAVRELRLARPPANALTRELLDALRSAVEEAPGSGARALVLSGRPGMFSAGLDVPQLLAADHPTVVATFTRLIELCHSITRSPLPVACAVTGHSPAGGAVMALFCDYRVMAEGSYRIGLNEVQVGISVPELLFVALSRWVGGRVAEDLLVHGRLVEGAEALELGLVDELAPAEEVVGRAVRWCEGLLSLPSRSVRETRMACRAEILRALEGHALEDAITRLVGSWGSDETQTAMRAIVARLAERKPG